MGDAGREVLPPSAGAVLTSRRLDALPFSSYGAAAPKLLHAERVGAGENGTSFCDIVLYAEDSVLTSHLGYKTSLGLADIREELRFAKSIVDA